MKKTMYAIYTLKERSYPLIHDATVRKLIVHSDPRGTLTEVLKTTWEDIYDEDKMPFTQVYYSTTKSGVARDKSDWHFHPGGQADRFVVIFGDIILAIYDVRENSPTKDRFNLFWMGQSLGNEGQYTIVIPQRILHCYLVVSKKPATLLNFPSRLYDPDEEGRIPFKNFPLPDGSTFSWEKVRKASTAYAKKI
ncbi:dTDP-4-dehydrorhamnose 3,5-epimerase family protein [Patescibacteria group bacterium]|nr:dTDP-4-dehydrorhamnose 3,5-epimerase family protein [Patescibacteria group bacterium]